MHTSSSGQGLPVVLGMHIPPGGQGIPVVLGMHISSSGRGLPVVLGMHISLVGEGATRRIGHAHFVKWTGTTRRIGHAHSARWPGNTRRIRHGHFVKWAGHIEVSLRYSTLPTQLLNRMSSFRSSLRCTSSRDASRAKGVGGRVVAVGCFGLPYDGLGPHLRPIPTSPNGRGSPQKSHPSYRA